jgi:hypothetical protein
MLYFLSIDLWNEKEKEVKMMHPATQDLVGTSPKLLNLETLFL